MRSLPTAFIAQKNKLVSAGAWVWCLKIQVDAEADDGFFITSHNDTVTLGSDVYDPYPVSVSGFGESLDGEQQSINIQIQDALLEFLYYAELYDGILANEVELTLVNLADLTSKYTINLKIDSVTADSKNLTIVAAQFNSFDKGLANMTYQRDFCRWEFLSTECGVDASVPGPGETCTKRRDGTFGCSYWGEQEVLASFPLNHPKRFGAFPSLVTGTTFEV